MGSPVFASNDVLKRFPKTRIFISELDPIRDPSFEFVVRLKKLGVDVKSHLMKGYTHGFCSFDIKNVGIEEFHNGTIKTIEVFDELFFEKKHKHKKIIRGDSYNKKKEG